MNTPIKKKRKKSSTERRIDRALAIAFHYRTETEAKHLRWTIDQMVRALCGTKYKEVVQAALLGTHHPNWDTGDCP